MLLGSMSVKAASKTLVKLTQEDRNSLQKIDVTYLELADFGVKFINII